MRPPTSLPLSYPPSHRVLSPDGFIGEHAGQATRLFTLVNAHGAQVSVCNYGARVVQILMPDRQGRLADVALGFNDLASLQRPAPHGVPSMGAFIGRYANRIAQARFELDGQRYALPTHSGPHCIHGGTAGSRYAVFSAIQLSRMHLRMQHRFLPEDDGFPGVMDLTLDYLLNNDNALQIQWCAAAVDAPSIASFTSHVFFNLSGSAESIDGHVLQINAARYLPLDAAQIPTGECASVQRTPFDFQTPRTLGSALAQPHPQLALCQGFDHHYAVNDWNGRLQAVATLSEPHSGRSMQVWSTEPGMQLFTANGLEQAACGFAPRSGVCLEPSYFPDSPNQPHFPSTRIAAGQQRWGEIVYAFTA